ncbi:class I SAM-dependent methyltransferase [uncultured Sunxiuqinia sp.]|uniref:class I SAM-dependent methyltransferase n=1 Tax=uncultured Sunxiuqinia sp. TaxID=1573825 RepID=UPI00261EE07C|nr:class I SAM-dependent methyltransferase [uncultured Sunxiuqinia sp.]
MTPKKDYIAINRESWNNKTATHLQSDFYDLKGFLAGKTSLKSIELELLGDVRGKSILHLQCHFGQDSLSLGRMGARVTGVDLSDRAIEQARQLAEKTQIEAKFICCDLYDLPRHLDEKFDVVFTSYGTIGWLPDLDRWARLIASYLKPNGQFIFAEFHPVVWMFDDQFRQIAYNYFNSGAIVETESGTYADRDAPISQEFVCWNHSLGEVITSLIENKLVLNTFNEFDYSPYNCFNNTLEAEPGKFRIQHLGNKLPMVYALKASLKKVTTTAR